MCYSFLLAAAPLISSFVCFVFYYLDLPASCWIIILLLELFFIVHSLYSCRHFQEPYSYLYFFKSSYWPTSSFNNYFGFKYYLLTDGSQIFDQISILSNFLLFLFSCLMNILTYRLYCWHLKNVVLLNNEVLVNVTSHTWQCFIRL